ncbi:MAG: hypothetical protein ACI9XZ_001616 [Alphaproteobacteria bacterium]|jgi:hypothetical protein
MALDFLKSIFLTLLVVASVAAMTWGLINNGSDPNGFSFAVLGLAAYLTAWMIGLYSISRST